MMLNGNALLLAVESHRALVEASREAGRRHAEAHEKFMARFPRGLCSPGAEISPENKACNAALKAMCVVGGALQKSMEQMRGVLGFCIPFPDEEYSDD